MGIQPMGFCQTVLPGESFQTPEAILVYSDSGLGEMSRRFHRLIREMSAAASSGTLNAPC